MSGKSSDLRDGVQTHLDKQKLHICQRSKGIASWAPRRGKSETPTPRLSPSKIRLGVQLFLPLMPGTNSTFYSWS